MADYEYEERDESSPERVLTSLEYLVLGLMSIEPQSGYSIINYFDEGSYSWNASPGSVYPMLKRLEKQGIIEGELEMTHETRPRKVYRLTALGEQFLDAWLRETPQMRPFYEQREMAMWRFEFMERRLTVGEILRWVSNYLDQVRVVDAHREIYHSGVLAAMEEYGLKSVHKQLLLESYLLDLNALRTWLEMARSRLEALARATGEFPSASPTSGEDQET